MFPHQLLSRPQLSPGTVYVHHCDMNFNLQGSDRIQCLSSFSVTGSLCLSAFNEEQITNYFKQWGPKICDTVSQAGKTHHLILSTYHLYLGFCSVSTGFTVKSVSFHKKNNQELQFPWSRVYINVTGETETDLNKSESCEL